MATAKLIASGNYFRSVRFLGNDRVCDERMSFDQRSARVLASLTIEFNLRRIRTISI